MDSHKYRLQLVRTASPLHSFMRFHDWISKGEKLIESCCIVVQLKVSQKKELRAEKFWRRVFPSMVEKMQDEKIVASCGKHMKTGQLSKKQILPTLFTLRNEESKIIAVVSLHSHQLCVATILGW